jgi:hypothetical protein
VSHSFDYHDSSFGIELEVTMLKIRHVVVVLGILLCPVAPATAQVSIGIGFPNVSIGINLPFFPDLVQVPDYPVYYAPQMDANYFFYDGMYWVYQNDNWYASSWYNGPWGLVNPEEVPLFVLRIPVRYYRQPPVYFRGWSFDAPPRWGDHWGRDWEQRRSGWDRWQRGAAPAPAPLPVYQRQYSGDRYPRQVEQQRELNRQNYRYQPNDPVVRQHYQAQQVQSAPAPAQRGTQGAPQERNPWLQGTQRSNPPPAVPQSAPTAPRAQAPQQAGGNVQKSAPTQVPPQQRGTAVQDQSRQPPRQGAAQHKQETPGSQGGEAQQQGKDAKPDPKHAQGQGQGRGQDQEQGRGQDQERGRDRNE